jgi:two-component system phosphate regulon sensor histidine kinase PhoR
MKCRIFWKFFSGFFLLSLLLSLAFYALVVGRAHSLHLRSQREALARLGGLVGAELAAAWPFADERELDAFIKVKGGQAGVRLTVIDPRGRVLADSQKDPAAMQNHADRPEFAAALSGRPRSETHFSFTLRERMTYHALPLRANGATVAALRLSQFSRDIDLMFAFWRQRVTVLLLALLAMSFLASVALSRNLTRPIRDLARAARDFGSGRWRGHVAVRRRDELGELAVEFNAMADRQLASLDDLKRTQHELEAILGSVSDGLLVIDAQERVTRAGPRFRQLVGVTDPLGRPYWETLRSAEFADLVRRAGAQSVHGEIEIHGRTFLASLSPLPDPGGTVVTFHDLSATRHLEREKRDFVANVSHELRTPLTAIKGYAETLAEEASGDAKKYLGIILRHADRLIELTQDLLTLAELEEKGIDLRREAVDWPELLNSVRVLFERKFAEKNLSLQVSLPADIAAADFKGDRFRLEQMLINLLDNALRYTEQGGAFVRLRRGEDGLAITVGDSGIGIPAADLPRIFERFFVVDKARSRLSGGTGLGLAIVKHIVRLHGGRIEVESAPGRGTEFTVTLPLAPAG